MLYLKPYLLRIELEIEVEIAPKSYPYSIIGVRSLVRTLPMEPLGARVS